jgi:hypothetical protein
MKKVLRFILRLLFGYRAFNTAALEGPGPLLPHRRADETV